MKNIIEIKPINKQHIKIPIVSTSPLIQHAWAEKGRKEMRDKHAGIKTKNREIRDPVAEYEAATYKTEEGHYGIYVPALKKAIIGAAHKDLGIEKTLVRKALFILCDDANKVLEINCADPVMREDTVRVGQGSTDLRYRPEFEWWSATVVVEFDADLLTGEAIANLVDRAGFGVGINEKRPEKDGEYGRFQVDRSGTLEYGQPEPNIAKKRKAG